MSYKEGCGRRRLLWLQSAEREARERQTATVHENQLALATRKQELNAREKEHQMALATREREHRLALSTLEQQQAAHEKQHG